MKIAYLNCFAALAVLVGTVAGSGAMAAEIDFEGLPAGLIPDTLTTGAGVTGPLKGEIGVFGFSPAFGASTNAAVVFDSSCPGGCSGNDSDLGTPNQTFGGPGVGAGGEAGQSTENATPLGMVLIIGEDLVDSSPADGLVDDPDDADLPGMFVGFDFANTGKGKNKGVMTVNSVSFLDVEAEQGETGVLVELFRKNAPKAQFTVPATGDNGVASITGIGLDDVTRMVVNLNGSGAISAVAVDEGDERFCWITTGGFHNAGVQSGGKDFTFGGNVGPPSSGSWQVIDHNTGDNFHTNDVHIVDCVVSGSTGPQQPGGKKGFDIDKALFAGTGRLNGVDGFPFEGFVIDAGEPAGKKGNDKDYFEIVVHDPVTNAIVFLASGELDGGNVQLHPPVGQP